MINNVSALDEGRTKITQPFWKAAEPAHQDLKLARDLARSGQHADCLSIISDLEMVEGFAEARSCFSDPVISSQLDRLCALHGKSN